MRKSREKQLPITPVWPDHQLAEELRVISEILDQNPKISDLVLQDVSDNSQMGASGLSGEQIVRAAVLKQMHQLSYEKLAFHLADSQSFRKFCRLPWGYTPSKSTLQDNISAIQASSWEKINQILIEWARHKKWEAGQKIRADSTAVKSPIHWPSDSRLLYDSVRKLTALLVVLACVIDVKFSDHRRRAKRRALAIANSRGKEKKKRLYQDLLKVTQQTVSYARNALHRTELWMEASLQPMLHELRHYTELAERVMDQSERRVLRGESVPAEEKVVSIFEEHTDIIRKGQREDIFGHKIFLTCGKSSLILDCQVGRGNPADSHQVKGVLERHQQRYGYFPRQASFDAGFAALENLDWAKEQGVQDVAFAKKRGLSVESMVRSSWVYKQLRRFRAGIEGCISTLKRAFGLDRCEWKGWEHFQQYVHLGVVSYNLVVLARLVLS